MLIDLSDETLSDPWVPRNIVQYESRIIRESARVKGHVLPAFNGYKGESVNLRQAHGSRVAAGNDDNGGVRGEVSLRKFSTNKTRVSLGLYVSAGFTLGEGNGKYSQSRLLLRVQDIGEQVLGLGAALLSLVELLS